MIGGKKILTIVFLFIFIAGTLAILTLFDFSFVNSAKNYLASLFFAEIITPEKLKSDFTSHKKIKIFIVPGHDSEYPGAEYNGFKEADFNLELAGYLENFFKKDDSFEVFTSRGANGYSSDILPYINNHNSVAKNFRDYVRWIFGNVVRQGKIEPVLNNNHSVVPEKISTRLYGINKWANDNKIDVIINVHFNDYPGHSENYPGTYSGFSVYVPEKQLPNSRASLALAQPVFEQLKIFSPVSDLPQEQNGIIEDQELIAIGSNASLDPASLLIEYGYIYEPRFSNKAARNSLFEEFAFRTYFGIRNFFASNNSEKSNLNFSALPYYWQEQFGAGSAGKHVLALQEFLINSGFYPPAGKSLRKCPVSAYFGDCTKSAVVDFQKSNNLKQSGIVDGSTLIFLNGGLASGE